MDGLDLSSAMEKLINFRHERNWEQFHTPKNLSMSISIESAELMEHFQWKNDREIQDLLQALEFESVKEEIADIASYLLLLTHDLGIDLNKAITEKVKKNEEKYPVEKCKGKHNKYTEL
ncbi:MAG: nucleotide pyrophosphohydrolase [Clostridia bacterium]|nr:nucleotide pyrophosphohydrolase [Clostridia bacterium]